MRSALPALSCFSGCKAALWLAAGLAVGCLTTSADPVTIRMADEDSIEFQMAGNNAARVQLSLSQSPPSSSGATLQVVNRDDFVLWSTELTRQGNQWVAQMDRASLEAVLTVDRIIADFPGATAEKEALRIVVPQDNYRPALEPLAPLVIGEPMFFAPPEPPEEPEVPSPNVERVWAESFAMTARRWEREFAAHLGQYAAARSRAHALFLDLRTAGRLPWSPDILRQIEQSYTTLKEREREIQQKLSKWRSTAQSFVQQWNSTHGNEPPVELKFADAS